MINAAIVGLGWWGKTLVEAVQQDSQEIHFVAGTTRTVTPEVQAFAGAQHLPLAESYEALLANPQVDAVVLATPHSMHASQVVAALQWWWCRHHRACADHRGGVYFGCHMRTSVKWSPSG